jgi:site-specific DNA-methyltransferase (adenine-specific)
MMMNLMQGDCLELMKTIPDGSVDMVLCDPPYGTTACKWDAVIPFEPMWEQVKRVLKKNGAAVFTASQPFTAALIMSNVDMFKYCWVWEKSSPGGFAQAKNMPLKTVEDVAVFSAGLASHASQVGVRRMPYTPQGLVHAPKTVRNTVRNNRGEESAFGDRPSHAPSYTQEWTNYPKQVLRFDVERGMHPTQKPVALMEYLIRTYTNEGETVLDFTMGSGTTGVAAKNLNRNFIGIELDPDYFAIAKRRTAEA